MQRTSHRQGGRAAVDAKLGIDVLQVFLDGGDRHHQPQRDLAIRQALGDQPQHVTLALGQRPGG